MRFVNIISALVVAALVYVVVLERDWLRALAQGETPDTPTQTEAAQPDMQDGTVSVVARQSQAQQVQSGIVLRGRTEAARRVDVRAEISGRVISEPMRRGATVAADDLLCELDPGTAAAQLAEARARLAEAEANAAVAQRLAESGFGAETQAISANAAVESARAGVLRAQNVIDTLHIKAPFAGILETDAAELGSLLQPGSLCATVIALDTIKLVGFAPELDIARISTGQLAGARLISGRELVGFVSFVSRSADPNTRTYRVEIEVQNPDLSIRDGETVEIVIALEGTRGHLLPQSVLTLDDSGNLGVRVVQDGKAWFHVVTILRDSPDGVWLAGLPDAADVIIVGQEYVTDGRPVSITREGDAQ